MKTEYTISKERHDEICKLELEAIKERDSLRADNDHLRQENERLKGEVEAWRSTFGTDDVKESAAEFDEQYRKVSELESTLATYKAAVIEARKALRNANFFMKDYLKYVTHPGVSRLTSDCDDALHTLSALTGDATPPPQ